MQFPNVITALVTPFRNDRIDIEGLQANIAFQLEQGIEGLLVLGTTGESPTLTHEERKIVIQTAVTSVNRRVPLFVGTGTNSTASTIQATLEAETLGADAALIVTPYYNRPTQEGIYAHFKAIAESTGLPLCAYNHPKRTGTHITVETLRRIAALPKVIGVKETSGDPGQTSAIINAICRDHPRFQVWCGDDAFTLPHIALGGHGVISVAANLVPKEMRSLVEKANAGNLFEAREQYTALFPLIHCLSLETNPIPVKAAMEIAGMAAGPCRLPLTEISAENREILCQTLSRIASLRTMSSPCCR